MTLCGTPPHIHTPKRPDHCCPAAQLSPLTLLLLGSQICGASSGSVGCMCAGRALDPGTWTLEPKASSQDVMCVGAWGRGGGRQNPAP